LARARKSISTSNQAQQIGRIGRNSNNSNFSRTSVRLFIGLPINWFKLHPLLYFGYLQYCSIFCLSMMHDFCLSMMHDFRLSMMPEREKWNQYRQIDCCRKVRRLFPHKYPKSLAKLQA